MSSPAEAPRRVPFLAMPFPLDEYLDALPGDYGKIARRLLRTACWTRQTTRNGVELDAGEVLMDERSEALWGGLVLDRDTTAKPLKEDGRRALVRRVLERLEKDALIVRRSAHAGGPRNGPTSGPRNGPSPTVVRFLKYREILWPASVETAQGSAQESAQDSAQGFGPILPVSSPESPEPPAPPTTLLPSPAAPAARMRKDADERFAPLRLAWERLFAAQRGEPYRWQGPKDAKAVNALIAVPVSDFEARATSGLTAHGFLRCSTVAQLNQKWNDLSGGVSPAAGSVTAPASPPTAFKGGRREW